jgi:hypothetical protein
MAIEAIENVQTIQLLTRSDEFCEKFRTASRKIKTSEMIKRPLEAVNFAVSQSFIYLVQCVGYALGLYLIIQQIQNANKVFQ